MSLIQWEIGLSVNTYFHNQDLPFFHTYSRDSRYNFQISVSRNRRDFSFLDVDQMYLKTPVYGPQWLGFESDQF